LFPEISLPRSQVKTKTLSPRILLKEVERALACKQPAKASRVLDGVLQLLHQQRGYLSIGLYVAASGALVRKSYAGPASGQKSLPLAEGDVGEAAASGRPQMSRDGNNATIVLPIKIASRILGVLEVEAGHPDAFSYKDEVLLKQVARLLARFLTSQGKLLVRHVREAVVEPQSQAPEGKVQPASVRGVSTGRKAAVGAVSRR
jgi:putative methionine-R-sulfoxide reductase with GAF domain